MSVSDLARGALEAQKLVALLDAGQAPPDALWAHLSARVDCESEHYLRAFARELEKRLGPRRPVPSPGP